MKTAACLLLCCALALPAAAEVKKWTDAQGRVHYGDRPPGDSAKTELRGTVSFGDGITLVPAKAGKEEGGTLPLAAPPQGDIWIYTTQDCGYCTRAKEHMKRKGLRYVEKDIEANPRYKAEFRTLGGRGVPVTLAGKERIVGFKAKNFDAFLKKAGF